MNKNVFFHIFWSFILTVMHYGKESMSIECEIERAEQIIEETRARYQNVSLDYNKTKRVTDSAIHLCLLTRRNTDFDAAILPCNNNDFVTANREEWKRLQSAITVLCDTFCPNFTDVEQCRDLVQIGKMRRDPMRFCESYNEGVACTEEKYIAPACDFQIKEKLFTYSQIDVAKNFKHQVCDAGCSDLGLAYERLKICWKHIARIEQLDESLKCSAHRNFSKCLSSSTPLCPQYTQIVSYSYTGFFSMEEECVQHDGTATDIANKTATSLPWTKTSKEIPKLVSITPTTMTSVIPVTEVSLEHLVTINRTQIGECLAPESSIHNNPTLSVQICLDILDGLACLVEKSVDIENVPVDILNEITRNFSIHTIRRNCSHLKEKPEVTMAPSTHPPVRTEMVRYCLNSTSILPLKILNFSLELCLDLMNFLSCLYQRNIPENEMTAVLTYISRNVTLSVIREKCPAVFKQAVSNDYNVKPTENYEGGFECSYGFLTTICADKKTIEQSRRRSRCKKPNSGARSIYYAPLVMVLHLMVAVCLL